MSSPILEVLARVGHIPLIERETELDFLMQRCRAALQSTSAVIAISGEPGIGKTRLALEASARLAAEPARVIILRCYEQTVAIPYAPWLNGPLADVTALLNAIPAHAYDISGTRLGIFEQVDQALLTYADTQPLLIILDDLHLADRATLGLLHHLARRGQRGGRAMMVTLRSTERRAPTPVGEFLADLAREQMLIDLPLAPLSSLGSAAIIEALLGPCPAELTATLAKRAAGIPFFLEELIRALVIEQRLIHTQHDWQLTGDSTMVPASIMMLILRRWRALSEETRRILRVAALIGTTFTLPMLSEVMTQPVTALREALAPALTAQFVQQDTLHSQIWHFIHALVRDALYTDIPPDERRYWHQQVVETLTQREHELGAALIAYHADRARAWQTAFDAHIVAAEEAQQRLASSDAVTHLAEARALLQSGVGITTRLPPFELDRRYLSALLGAGRMEEALLAARTLAQVASSKGDCATEGWAWVRLGQAAIFTHHLDQAEVALKQGIAIAEEMQDDQLLVTALAEVVVLCDKRGALVEGEAAVQRALPLAEQIGNHGLALHGLIYYGFILNWRGQFPEAIAMLRDAYALATDAHDVISIANARFALALALGGAGEYGEAFRELQQLLDFAAVTGSPYYAIRAPNTIGWLYRELGLATQAREWDERAITATTDPNQPGYSEALANSLLNLASDFIVLGQYDSARETLYQAELRARADEFMRWRNLNRLALCQGELALARGDATAALAYTRDALAQAQTSAAQKYICQAHDLAGRAEMALGKFTEALASLEKSVAIAEAIGYRAGLWRTLATLSKLYRQLGRLQPARQAHTRAAEALTSILMTVHDPDIVRLLHELPEVQAILVAGQHARRGYPAGLTEREAQVLRLVAHGQTNHEIAAALVLSERTVNSHLVRIFNKLGINSRAAAAAFATRHGLDE
jgi:DNA-binding CsgD family transcriptional regulator/tetratricopeptide (TPR) repeat protein